MIRRVQLNIGYATTLKLQKLDEFCQESRRVINLYIDRIWKDKDFSSKFITTKVSTWLSARIQQCLGKQALETVKSQRKKKRKRHKPVFTKNTFNLDSRFIKFEQDVNSFDFWVTLTSLGNKLKLALPSKKHNHFNKFKRWTMRKSLRLRCNNGKYYIDVYFEKDAPTKKRAGKTIGLDIGYKKLIVTSDGKVYGRELEKIYSKISRKKQKSKAFKRALVERDNKTNEIVKQLPFKSLKTIVVEDLKNVKKNTRGNLNKKFVNKLQRWSYRDVLDRLCCLTEEHGITLKKVNPAYTSQTCSSCGVVCKQNRKGEVYECACGLVLDADINASINILHLGVYSP